MKLNLVELDFIRSSFVFFFFFIPSSNFLDFVPANIVFFCFFFFLIFLGLHPWHMEVPRLRVESELQLPVYATATATRDPSHIFNLLHHSALQHQIPNPLSEARDQTRILIDTSRVH